MKPLGITLLIILTGCTVTSTQTTQQEPHHFQIEGEDGEIAECVSYWSDQNEITVECTPDIFGDNDGTA